jgi:UPF0755 protein
MTRHRRGDPDGDEDAPWRAGGYETGDYETGGYETGGYEAGSYEGTPRQPDAARNYLPSPWDEPDRGAQRQARGALGTSSSRDDRPGEETGPPWELPGWDDSQPIRGAPRSSGPAGSHPSGPLPRVSSSGPLPRVPADSWPGAASGPLAPLPPATGGWPEPADGDRPGHGFGSERSQGSRYPAEPYPGRDGYPNRESYPGRDGYPDRESYPGGGSHYPGRQDDAHYLRTGMTDPGYGGGRHADPEYPDAGPRYQGYGDPSGPAQAYGGYDHDDYGDERAYPGERFGGDHAGEHEYAREPDYPPGNGYPPGDGYPPGNGYPGDHRYLPTEGHPAEDGYVHDGGYPGHTGYADDQEAGYPRHDREDDRGYGEHADWYGDVDDDQAWSDDEADDDELGDDAGDDHDDGILPGLSRDSDPRRTRAGAAGYDRAPRGGGEHGTRSRNGSGGKGKGRKGPLRRAAPWIALSVVVVLLAVVGGVGYHFYRTYLHPPDYSGPGTGEVTVHITSGETATEVGQQLVTLGVVESVRAFSNAAKNSGHDTALEVGYYRLHKHMNAALAFAMLLKPSSRVQVNVLIPPGLRLYEAIDLLGKDTGNPTGYQQAIKDVSQLGLPSYAKGNPEGYLFPDTYTVQPGTSPTDVLREMVEQFNKEAASLNLPAVAARDRVSETDIIITASLVQAEGKRPKDLPKIARVIYNRLNAHMPLELDSTVLYALHSRASDVTIAQTRHTKSPYNTYLHTGLPPGPIDSPPAAAIHAALHPTPGNWTYFLTVNPKTGLTKFTNNYQQFLTYVAELNAYNASHH